MGVPDFCPDCGSILDISTAPEVACDCCGKLSKAQIKPPETSSSTNFPSALRTKLLSKTQVVTAQDMESTKTIIQNCPNCNKNEMTWTEAQLRGADEGSTIFYRCKNCGHRFQEGN